jgi:peroxiredoxin
VQKHYEEFRQLGAELLVVTQAQPPIIALFLRDYPLPFPVVSDPERAGYKGFGLERTSWGRIMRPGIAFRFLRLLFRGWRPRRPRQGEDVLQLGGDFVLDGQGRLRYAYRSAEPTDRPSVAALLQAVREASRPEGDGR